MKSLPTKIGWFISLAVVLASRLAAPAQTADQAWLRYPGFGGRTSFPRDIRALGSGAIEQSAVQELKRSLGPLATGTLTARTAADLAGQTIVGTVPEFRQAFPDLRIPANLEPGGYWIDRGNSAGSHRLLIVGADQPGVLYGTFALLRPQAFDTAFPLIFRGQPAFPIRWVDEWDNADGSIERGYAGRSIFFENGHVRDDLKPVAEYARLLASVGINGCNLNNVNNAAAFLQPEMLHGIARVANAMRPYGVRVGLSVDIASPQKIGGLSTYDPLDPVVKSWWATQVNEIYSLIPDFAGFTVKADSEGQPGPASYGRTPADAANTLAALLAPHGGVVLYRAFVYNHHADWRDPKADRARAAYDIFHPLDGKFASNVVLQIKEGPIDFQAQEPVSPLFGGLAQTSAAMEVQITQEYTGKQRHLVYLAPMWKQVLDFDMRVNGAHTPVQKLLARNGFGGNPGSPRTGPRPWGGGNPGSPRAGPRPWRGGGMVGVSGVGRDAWLGSPLALANLYAFGRLAWDPNLTPEQFAGEWTRQTISTDPEVVATVSKMLMQSWPAYVNYTGPLGMQTLTDITGSHYGPNIESSENNGWGQWHRADHDGVGMDRTVVTGTGFIGQYSPEVAKLYESAATTPDNLLVFFHHVPYTYKLHDGKTVIQYIYDSHYEGAAQAAEFVQEWQSLKGRIDPALYDNMLLRLQYQAGHAIVWRDAIVQYFLKLSGIPDDRGRAGHYPGRLEAEDARLTGYKVIDITPWEDASGGKAVNCPLPDQLKRADQVKGMDLMKGTGFSPDVNAPKSTRALAPEGMQTCSAEWTYAGAPGRFDIAIQYFDLQGGVAKFTLTLNGQPAGTDATWSADATMPSRIPNGDNTTRHFVRSVDLKPGDSIRIEGTPDAADPAALDYIEIQPAASTP